MTISRAQVRVPIWCCENLLLINPDKAKFMLIGIRQLMSSHSVDLSVSFMGRTLTPVDSARDLGVIMDSHLTYDSHISYLVSSCYLACVADETKPRYSPTDYTGVKFRLQRRLRAITNSTIFLYCKIIRVVVGGVVIVFGELIVSWVPRCRRAFSSLFL